MLNHNKDYRDHFVLLRNGNNNELCIKSSIQFRSKQKKTF